MNCPIGAYTHGIELSGPGAQGLNDMVGMMVSLQYIRSDEVPEIPRKPTPTRYVVYAPLSKAAGIGIPGPAIADTIDSLRSVVNANRELEAFHQARQQAL